MKHWRNFAFVCLLAACATPQTQAPNVGADTIHDEALAQQRFVYDQRVEEQRRVLTIHRRLSAANLEFCKTQSPSIGASFLSLPETAKETRAIAESNGVADTPTVLFVLDNAPAQTAGLKAGDVVTAAGGQTLQSGAEGEKQLRRAIQEAQSTLALEVRHAGAAQTVTIKPEPVCGYPIVITSDQDINAAADGQEILLQRGMLHFVQNDNELALVIGHELAHNAMGHISAQRRNATMGMLGGAVIDALIMAGTGVQSSAFMRAGANAGAGMYSQEFETEADYVGLYFMVRAGYDPKGVEAFWRRMAAENPKGITFASSHPTSAARYATLAKAEEEIAAKQAAGAPLRPRMKNEQGDETAAAPASIIPSATQSSAPPAPPTALTP